MNGAGLDGVHGTGINLEKVALVDRQYVEHVVPAAVLDHLRGLGAVVRALADNDRGTGLAVQHATSTRFCPGCRSRAWRRTRRWDNLDRKVVLGVQNLNEQWELLALAVAEARGARPTATTACGLHTGLPQSGSRRWGGPRWPSTHRWGHRECRSQIRFRAGDRPRSSRGRSASA